MKYKLYRYSDNSITLEYNFSSKKYFNITLLIPKLIINSEGIYIDLSSRFCLYKFKFNGTSYNLELVVLGFGVYLKLDLVDYE